MYPFLLVGAGGAIGAMARFGLGSLIGRLWPMNFPLGTLFVNVLGSLAMGVFIGTMAHLLPAWQNDARLFAAIGVLGGFTTFSTFSLDTVAMLERGELLQAGVYVLLSVVVCLAGLYLGLLVTRGMA